MHAFLFPGANSPEELVRTLAPSLRPECRFAPLARGYKFKHTIFTRLSAAALFKFSELQMRRSFEGGVQSGAALFKKIFYL
jgi:hypothetical protein